MTELMQRCPWVTSEIWNAIMGSSGCSLHITYQSGVSAENYSRIDLSTDGHELQRTINSKSECNKILN